MKLPGQVKCENTGTMKNYCWSDLRLRFRIIRTFKVKERVIISQKHSFVSGLTNDNTYEGCRRILQKALIIAQ